jgi:putative PEP-CTERM system histidine kinase
MRDIGAISYGTAALAFLVLTLVMLTSWRGRLQGALLTSAAIMTVAWATGAAYHAIIGYPATILVPLLELARDVGWYVFLLRLMTPSLGLSALMSNRRITLAVTAIALCCGGLVVILLYPPLFSAPLPLALGVDARILGHLMLAVVGLALVEQLYRNTLPERRWAIKYLCLGVGGLFAYDFFLYSDALLFKRVDEHWWIARGFVNALVVPFIGVAAARNPEWSLDVYVSRSMVFHTTTLLGAGLYLLVMAIGGYYLRIYGGHWGQVIQAIFLFSAVLVLLAILFSGQVRARLKVFLNKHFFNYKYDYREEWLRFIKTLSTVEQNTRLRELTIRAVAEIVDSPGGLLWLRNDPGPYENTANWNTPPMLEYTERPDGGLARFLETTEWVVEIDEYMRAPERYAGMTLPGWISMIPRAWLIVPLMQHERLLGFMVLMRPRAPREIEWEDCDLLKTAGRQVASHLAQLQATEALFDARQFETFNRLSAYVVHDLKNLVAQLSLVVSNAARHKHNPQFMEDAILTVEHCVQKMNQLLAQLRTGRDRSRDRIEKTVPLIDVVKDAIAAKQSRIPVPVLSCRDTDIYVRTDPARLGTVLGHVIQNAQEATPPEGTIAVAVYRSAEQGVIEVRDSGCGMDADFVRDRLFRPFETTKGKSGMGIGAYETREWVREHGGEVEVESQPEHGTVFRIRLPCTGQETPHRQPASDAPETTL